MRRSRPRPEAEPPARIEWAVVGRLLPYLREFPRRLAVAMGCLLAAKLAGVALPMVLGRAVDALDVGSAAGAAVSVPVALLLAYGLLRFASVAFGELRDVVFSRISERAMRRVALRVFRHLHALDVDFHLARRTGGLSRDIERGLAGISFLLRFLVFNIVPTLLEIALVSAILWLAFDWRFTLIAVSAVAVFVAFSVRVTEWRTGFVREANARDSEANARAVDALLNHETVKLFGNEDWEAGRYDEALRRWERAIRRNRASLAALNGGQALIVGASITVMMLLAGLDVAAGRLSLGDFVAVNAYMVQLFMPLNFLGFVYREIRRALTDMQRMFSLLDERPKVADAPDAVPLADPRGTIRFDAVHFAYGPDRPILRGVSFELPPGQKLAIVGPSGAGKSTIARLLFRLYDPQAGTIRIGEQALGSVTLGSLRRHIGVVPQDTVLFNDTIGYNIAYGMPGADEAAIARAVQLAQLEPFIARLPRGLDTRVGERGLKLSGGEKQRVAIARALLRDPEIMVFDEATSSLDSAAEQAILAAIRQLAAHRTSLVIAHRLSTVTDADRILFLRDGVVVEQGTHAELVARDGAYAAMWRLQHRQSSGAPADSERL